MKTLKIILISLLSLFLTFVIVQHWRITGVNKLINNLDKNDERYYFNEDLIYDRFSTLEYQEKAKNT
ncbi:hypothetical protein [Volucribacter amazonae]|uniref:Uncharacterized protein n=1 Tax=Volucribacter amazonae TaxID=256731 RepID=A0A9X4PLT0_9PAST|nr:hypothetical protein [Volucribacter amazonae]MDG6894128.1 hypothetical protein [Volucribacter amazonae]